MTTTSFSPDLDTMPALAPPPGVTPNFRDPYSLAAPLRAVYTLAVVLTTLTTFVRLYTKFFIMKVGGWEDCTHLSIRTVVTFSKLGSRYHVCRLGMSTHTMVFEMSKSFLTRLQACFMVQCALLYVNLDHYAGVHQWNVPMAQVFIWGKVRSKMHFSCDSCLISIYSGQTSSRSSTPPLTDSASCR